MFEFKSENRLTLEFIKQHEWYTGQVATDEEIKADFTKRNEETHFYRDEKWKRKKEKWEVEE